MIFGCNLARRVVGASALFGRDLCRNRQNAFCLLHNRVIHEAPIHLDGGKPARFRFREGFNNARGAGDLRIRRRIGDVGGRDLIRVDT